MKGDDLRTHPVFFPLATALLLAAMGGTLFFSAQLETCTIDEITHITHGYDYLKTGNSWLDQAHPALPRLLVGLPLLAVNPRVPTEHVSRRTYDFLTYRHLFLFRNRVRPDTMLAVSRLATMSVTVVLGLVLALWTRKHFGVAPALCALALYTLSPLFLAYGRYSTTDVFTAAIFFFSVIAWARFVESRRWRDLALPSLLVGAAMASKGSMVILFALLPLLYLIRKWQEPERFPVARLAVSMAAIGVAAILVVGLVYWPVTAPILFDGGYMPLADHLDRSTPMGAKMMGFAELLHLPYHPYLMSFYYIGNAAAQGTPTYLLGEVYSDGRWYFLPVAFAVKSTSALLLGLAASLVAICWLWTRRGAGWNPRQIPFPWIVIGVTTSVFVAICLPAKINSGIRHLLPIYPFLFAFVGAVLAGPVSLPRLRKARTALLCLIAALLLVESVGAYPDYLAFFNLPSGGSENGYRYLVNPNLDWGQDVKKLKAYLGAEGIPEVCLAYFGQADPDYYGIRHRPLPRTWEAEERRNLNCFAAVSATFLAGLYVEPGSFDWLRELEPVASIGHSINIYDLRKAGATQ